MGRRIGHEAVRVFAARWMRWSSGLASGSRGWFFWWKNLGKAFAARRALLFPQRDTNGRVLTRESLYRHPLVSGLKGRIV